MDEYKATHYHGGPMWGNVPIDRERKIWCGEVLYKNSCALVSYARPDQLRRISKIAKRIVLDNGAFSFWRNAKKKGVVPDWDQHWAGYYAWVLAWFALIEWFLIPDVIAGTEEENDRLLNMVPSSLRSKAVPVWHSTESIERLVRLCKEYDRVAIGLCGEHASPMSKAAARRLDQAFYEIYIRRNLTVKIHGLRMLDGRILGKYPIDSADSSFVAVNVPKTDIQMPEVKCKLARTAIYKAKIEAVMPPATTEWARERSRGKQLELF